MQSERVCPVGWLGSPLETGSVVQEELRVKKLLHWSTLRGVLGMPPQKEYLGQNGETIAKFTYMPSKYPRQIPR